MAFDLMKLLPAKHIIDLALRSGEIDAETTVIETSSGTFAYGMSLVCNQYGLRSHIVSDPSMDDTLKRRLEWLGTTVEIVPQPAVSGGYQAARLALLHKRIGEGKTYWTRQYDNINNNNSYDIVAKHVAEVMKGIDVVVASIGSGGSICGLISSLRQNNPDLFGIAVDTNGSVLFGQTDKPRLLRGMGNSILPKNLKHELVDEIHWLDANQAYYFTKKLFCENNLFMGPTSGAAYSVAEWYAKTHPEKNVVVVLPDQGYRYQGTVYNDQWLDENGMTGWLPADNPATVSSPLQAGEGWTKMNWNRRVA
jgi:cysteine synthase A